MEGFMSERDKITVRRGFEELFTRGQLDIADEVFSQDYVGHDATMPRDIRGPSEAKQLVQMYRSAFPDLKMIVEEQLAEGDLVATRFTASGTHRGELMGIAPTGAKVTVTGVTVDRMKDGKSVESWTSYDALGMLRQLGAIPPSQLGAQPSRA
jgi:steroid delta-isomerase-like uncharacterized protein